MDAVLCALSWDGGRVLRLTTLATLALEAELGSLIGCKNAKCRIRGGTSGDEPAHPLRLRGGVGGGVLGSRSGGEGEPGEGRGATEGAECQGEGRSLDMKRAVGQPGEPPEGRAGPRWVIDAEARPGRGGAKAGLNLKTWRPRGFDPAEKRRAAGSADLPSAQVSTAAGAELEVGGDPEPSGRRLRSLRGAARGGGPGRKCLFPLATRPGSRRGPQGP